ncbi:beta-ketoacyl synthase N-terminal-like domain-containing protein [Streptomyces sp. NPDC002928]|uniref:beta-ketoacyl synthase N-terminal-like domain-containing protein n=1 Tax=Streptomyces sp. NPDC002928 TaxID=3154440 RepID=UPI0033B163AA
MTTALAKPTSPAPSSDGPGTAWTIAGTGLVTSVGANTREVFEALCAARTGLGELRAFDTTRLRTRHAFEIGDRPGPDTPRLATQWLCRAVAEAARDAGLTEDLSDVPILIGTGLRELRSVELAWLGRASFDLEDLHFGRALRERFGACDTHTFAGACSASLYTLGIAADLLAADRADTVVVAAADTITASMYGLLDRVQTATPRAVRPFDRDRQGQLLGDGAAALVLRRNGPGRAVLRSVGLHCDARHVTAPDVEGMLTTLRQAHERAGIGPADVDLVCAQGTGTLANDAAEAEALARVFEPCGHGGGPLVTAVEAMTGHTSGCSGLLGTVIAVESLRTGRVPPTVGLRDPIGPASVLRFTTEGPVEAPGLTTAQVNAFGFGGLNAAAIVGKAA